MASNNIIGIPANSDDFEEKCVILFSCLCGDPNFKKIGTRGKNQSGLDLIGTRNGDPGIPVGVQCKLVTKSAKLDLQKVESDIRRALLFTPHLAEIYVATTASDDQEYDKLTLKLRQEQKTFGRRVDVQIWGWDTLQGHIRKHLEARNAFDPDYSASTGVFLDTTKELLAVTKETHSSIARQESEAAEQAVKISEIHAAIVNGDNIQRVEMESMLDRQVDGFRDILNEGKPKTALRLLEKFEKELPVGASKAIKSRVRANIGFAKLKTGDDTGCVEALRYAFETNPTDDKAMANSLLADILEGHPETAIKRAKEMFATSPPNAFAASYVYQAGAALEHDADIGSIVPSEIEVDENIGVNRVCYLRKHREDEWWLAAAELAAKLPDSGVAQRFAAEALLEQSFRNQQLPASTGVGRERQEKIAQAATMLQSHWNTVRQYENASEDIWLSVAINLSTAYRALRMFEQAQTVIAQALAIDPENGEVLISGAHVDLVLDRPNDALAKIENLPDTPQRTIVLASVYGELNRWSDIVQLVTPEQLDAIGSEDRPLVDAIHVRAVMESAATLDAKNLIDELIGRWPGDNRILIAAADLAFRKAPDVAADYLQKAVANLQPDCRYSDRLMLADCALRRNKFDAVLSALDTFVETDKVSEPLLWLALAFINSPIRPRTAEFFAELGPDVISNPRFARLAGYLDYYRGDLRSAERHLRIAIEGDARDLRSILMLQGALERAGKADAARRVIVDVDEKQFDDDPHDQMRLAALLSHYDEGERGLKLGYAVASNNRNDEKIVCVYPGILFSSKIQAPLLKRGGKIENGDWVSLKAVDGDKIERLITNDPTPDVTTVSPDNEFAVLLLGATQGDEIAVDQPFGPKRIYSIEEVKTKFLWLFDDVTRSHATRFPGSGSMGMITMNEGDVQPVLDVVRASVDYDRAILDFYRQHPVPLEMLAAMHNKSPISISELILHYGGEIDTCFGSNEEREAAVSKISLAKGKGAVIDTVTAWCLIHFELIEPFRNYFGRLAIAQSTIDDLLELRAREEFNVEQEYMTLGFEGEQAVRQIHTPAETKARITSIDQSIAMLREKCEVLPVDGFDDIELASVIHRDTIERSLHAVQIAKNNALFLLSDDFRLRQMNDVYGSQRSGWIQTTAQFLNSTGEIDSSEYARVVGRLAARKHGYISVNGKTLADVLCMDVPQADAYFDLVADYIGGTKAEIVSHVYAVADFMSRIWTRAIPSWRKGRACGKLIENLIRHRGDDWPAILGLIEQRLGSAGSNLEERPDLGKTYLRGWIAGHFLWPSVNAYAAASSKSGKKRNPKE